MNPSAAIAAPSTTRKRRRGWWAAAFFLALAGGGWLGCELWAGWHERQAQAQLDDEKLDSARRHIARALVFHSDRFSTHLLAARIERARRDYPEAEKHLLRCKEIDGMTERLQLEFVLLRCERGEVDELAPQLLAAVASHHPESPAILESLALVYMRQARYPDAIKVLDQWVELAPESPRAHDWRGWVNNQLDIRAPAIDDYVQVLKLKPDRSTVRLRLAQLLIDSKRHPEALPHLERLFAEQPENPEVLVGLAACRAVQLRQAEARQLLDQVLAAHPDDFAALLLYGEIERQDERYSEAERWLRKAVALKPLDHRPRYALHLALAGQPDRQEEAEAERKRWESDRQQSLRLTTLLRGDLANRPNDPDLAAEAGELLLKFGEDQRGLFWLKKALAVAPRHLRSHRVLAAYYERIHDTAHAEEHRKFLSP